MGRHVKEYIDMQEDDAALRAALTQIVLTDLRVGRSSLSPPALAALRMLASGPGSGPSAVTDDDRARHGLRRADAPGAGDRRAAAGSACVGPGPYDGDAQPEVDRETAEQQTARPPPCPPP